MSYKYFIFIYITQCIHYKFGEEKIMNENLKIYPFLYVKNSSKISILFWDKYNEWHKNLFLQIKCKKNTKSVFRKKYEFYLDNNYYLKKIESYLNILQFDTKVITYKINNQIYKINFNCDLKYWVLIYKWKNLKNSYLTNLQIFDSNEFDPKTNFLNPLVFVDLKNHNINTRNFNNKFNFYHGGFNLKNGNINSNINSVYDNFYGVNWIVNKRNQFIELDEKMFYEFNKLLNKSFTFYINFDIFYNVLDNSKKKTLAYDLYKINIGKRTALFFNIYLMINTNKIQLLFFENTTHNTLFNKEIIMNKLNKKEEVGVKFLIYSHYKTDHNKLLLGFKKNSSFKLNNNLIFESFFPIYPLFKNKNQKYKHFIGLNQDNNLVFFNKYYESMIIINEYGIFSGTTFDNIEINDNDIFLKLIGNHNFLITNNINLDRRFNLYSKKEITKCKTFKCVLCDINDICLYCYYNYYLDNSKNCILNNESDRFVNEFSEIVIMDEEINNNEFIQNNNIKSINSLNLLDTFNLDRVIIFLNFKIKIKNENNVSKFSLDNSNKYNYNFFFNNKIKNYPLNIQINSNLNINSLKLEIKDNKNYELNIFKYNKQIKCDDIENQLFYNNIDCYNICSSKGINYFYKPINYKKGYCVKKIKNGYFWDSNNLFLKCKNNCLKCSIDNIENKYRCEKCMNGYKLINNYCYFNNEFNCINNSNSNEIFDNNNTDGIRINEEFCNLCKQNNGLTCTINNLDINYNGIKPIKYNENFIKSNIESCLIYSNNKCIKCNNKFFWNENNYCINCQENCFTCNEKYNCIICNKGYFLKNKICLNCNSKFNNCLECNNEKCLKSKTEKIKKEYLINNCNACNNNNECIICNKNYYLKNNKCKCELNNNFLDKNNKCLNCNNCKYCIQNSKNICNNCIKCKNNKIFFNYIQNKNEIIISYNKDLVEIYENYSFFKVINSKYYRIIFKNNNIIIKIFEYKLINAFIIINKNVIKNLKEGFFEKQIIKLKNIDIIHKNVKVKNKKINFRIKKIKKYYFPKINFKNKIIKNTIKYTNNIINYSRFITIFLPIIININQSGLIILLNTKFGNNFLTLLKLIKKTNIPIIKNENLFTSKEFNDSFTKIKKLYKNNVIIGEINLIDMDLLLMFIILFIYYIFHFLNQKWYFKQINKNKLYKLLIDNYIYLKLIPLTIFQSYLIKNYYKIIFFIEIFFDLNNNFLKLLLFILIQFYIILIILYFNYNHYFSQLFLNPFFKLKTNYYEKILIKFFVIFENKYCRNLNIIMNFLDFFLVLIFMKLKNNFINQIIMIKFIIIVKILYLTNLFLKIKKNILLTQIISYILLLNFYFIIFLNHYFDKFKEKSYFISYFFLFINIWEILRVLFNNLFKLIEKKKI